MVMNIMNDIAYQAQYICAAVDRMLAQINMDPLSPTYGCAHLAYWRDKTSDVADIRRQEAMFAFALLFTGDYPDSSWHESPALLAAIQALLTFWNKSQYLDGSLDEWYKGERAFAAAAFSAHAVARTLHLVAEVLPAHIVSESKQGLEKTGRWLCRRNDLFKTNHQAVGVSALAWAGWVLDNQDFFVESKNKLKSIVQAQTAEGWFPEVGHMDLGYTFLTVEYSLMAMERLNDFSLVQPFVRALEFACQFIHPDLTVGYEYGVCHNPYLSRIALMLVAPYSSIVRRICGAISQCRGDFKHLRCVLADDLRLMRWAFQPLLAYDMYRFFSLSEEETFIVKMPISEFIENSAFYPAANIFRISVSKLCFIFAPCAGGLLRFFAPGVEFTEIGYVHRTKTGILTNKAYNRMLPTNCLEFSVQVTVPFSPVKQFMPSFLARVILRITCSTAFTSSWTRKGIDIIRKRKGSALNQSSTNLSTQSTSFLIRQVSWTDTEVHIKDTLRFATEISTDDLYFLQTNESGIETTSLVSSVAGNIHKANEFTILRTYCASYSWLLTSISVFTQEQCNVRD